ATRGAATKLRESPYTETAIDGVESVVYKPGIAPVPASGSDTGDGELGTFQRGLQRISGFMFSSDGSAAETLFAIDDEIDLIIRYRANGQKRKRTLKDVVFVGDATVTIPALNTGVSDLIGVPFRVQIPEDETLADHIEDAVDS
ncbi:MAG: hypothetical protein WBE26_08010, partial [Phycisphaerae bacterium]